MNKTGVKAIVIVSLLLLVMALYGFFRAGPAAKLGAAQQQVITSSKVQKKKRVKPLSAPQPAASQEPEEPQERPEPKPEEPSTEPPKEKSASSPEVQEIIRQNFSDEMKKHLPMVLKCYEAALDRSPELSGRLDLTMVIEQGDVIDVAWDEDSTYDDGLISCVEDSIIGMQVDKRMNGNVTYPLLFSPE